MTGSAFLTFNITPLNTPNLIIQLRPSDNPLNVPSLILELERQDKPVRRNIILGVGA